MCRKRAARRLYVDGMTPGMLIAFTTAQAGAETLAGRPTIASFALVGAK
jgi:hypothetical protein